MKPYFLLLLFFSIFCASSFAQDVSKLTAEDKTALENIIVEKYYVSDSLNSLDSILPKGSVTYRIYVDLKPNYTLQLIYGDERHPLTIQTSTRFYNNIECGAVIGYNVHYLKLNNSSFALDSWITINSASNQYAGVLLKEDVNGSVLKRKSFEKADGLTTGNLPLIKPFNLDINFFDNDTTASVFTTNDGGWAAISGIKSGCVGPTADNKILIAQLTTDGEISFQLNMQLGTPSGEFLKFVWKDAEVLTGEFLSTNLCFPAKNNHQQNLK